MHTFPFSARWLGEQGRTIRDAVISALRGGEWIDDIYRFTGSPPDSLNINLSGIDLEHLDLAGCDLSFLRLDYANFSGAKLDSADLQQSELNGANFEGASLEGANLVGCIARAVSFKNANLTRALMMNADLTAANFQKADLTHAALSATLALRADFSNAVFHSTDLDLAHWPEALLRDVAWENVTVNLAHLPARTYSERSRVETRSMGIVAGQITLKSGMNPKQVRRPTGTSYSGLKS